MASFMTGPFAMRRIHSLSGLWFLLFLIEHLFTNSQAALWVGERGRGFIQAVNFIHNLPYLGVIEVVLLGVPIAVHAALGIQYAMQAKMNDTASDGTRPTLKYGRNRAYSWQRITAYFLLFMLIFHVGRFRFLEYPRQLDLGDSRHYLVKITQDPGLNEVAERMGVELVDNTTIKAKLSALKSEYAPSEVDAYEQRFNHLKIQEAGACMADSLEFGTATLLTVRDTFKNKLYGALYSLFVLAAVFHGGNGFWTFCITWGLIFKASAQRAVLSMSMALMFVLSFLGLAAIWGTYFVTLRG